MGTKPNIDKIFGRLLQHLSKSFADQSFYLQSQMDIHPKSRYYNLRFIEKTGGFYILNDSIKREIVSYKTPWDIVRRDMLILLLKDILMNQVKGDLVELGVYKGFTAKLIHYYVPERMLYLFDTYGGFDKNDLAVEKDRTGHSIQSHFKSAGAQDVISFIKPKNDNVMIVEGVFPGSIPENFSERSFSLIHIDMDLFEPTLAALNFFYPRMSKGGYMVIHDYNTWSGAHEAVEEFFREKAESPVPMPDKNGSALVKKI
ncbi:MAG: class I SAM-dependent methyltransferase [Bacteroidia bacterium]|nr:class I SAM-dependent methyltransferase [Bacteroidia bacterium]